MGLGKESMAPHNLTLTVLGASLVWVGWFGFNGGSALGANGSAAYALVTTQIAAAAAAIAWLVVEKIVRGKGSVLGAASGAVAGLVVITPAAGFVTVSGALIMGLIGGVVCFWGISGLKRVLKADDSLDAFGLHGVGGIVGAILTAVFASSFIMGDKAPTDVMHQNGGLQGALAKLQGAGLAGQVQSWVDPSQGNGAVNVEQIQSLFGGQQVEQVAQQANVPTNDVYGAISTVLPQIIDSLTPQGDATDHTEANGDIQNVMNLVSGFLK